MVQVAADVSDLLGVHDVHVLVLAEELPRRSVLLFLRLLAPLRLRVAGLFVHVGRVVAADLPSLALGIVTVVRVAVFAVLVLFLLVPTSRLAVAEEDCPSHICSRKSTCLAIKRYDHEFMIHDFASCTLVTVTVSATDGPIPGIDGGRDAPQNNLGVGRVADLFHIARILVFRRRRRF